MCYSFFYTSLFVKSPLYCVISLPSFVPFTFSVYSPLKKSCSLIKSLSKQKKTFCHDDFTEVLDAERLGETGARRFDDEEPFSEDFLNVKDSKRVYEKH